MSDDPIGRRKEEHLVLALGDATESPDTESLYQEVQLVHDALPEMALDEVDASTVLCGRPLRLPFLIASMTGGTEMAGEINRALASLAERRGLGFAVGSQRIMNVHPERAESFRVREVAPTALVMGNIGAIQARELGVEGCLALKASIGADVLCVHLNAAQELVQPEGDRDFRGALEIIAQLAAALGEDLVVKETGCGISPSAALRLRAAGVRTIDVSGAGGTSWTRIESLRASGAAREVGEALAGWGIPAAAAVAAASGIDKLDVIAGGGIRSGVDAARALALGARAVSFARPMLVAWNRGGTRALEEQTDAFEHGLRAAMLLTGSRDLAALRRAPRVLGPRLRAWLEALRA